MYFCRLYKLVLLFLQPYHTCIFLTALFLVKLSMLPFIKNFVYDILDDQQFTLIFHSKGALDCVILNWLTSWKYYFIRQHYYGVHISRLILIRFSSKPMYCCKVCAKTQNSWVYAVVRTALFVS